MRFFAVLLVVLVLPVTADAKRPLLMRNAAQAKATRVLQDHLRFVIDDVPAQARVGQCSRLARASFGCPYGLVLGDGELFASVMVLRRQRDGLIGWRLLDELPIRWPDDPVKVVPF